MSDSDSSTDPEDFEYIPEGDAGSDSEASVCGEEEERRGVARSGATKKQATRRKRKTSSNTRKRRGGIKLKRDSDSVERYSDGVIGEDGEDEEGEEEGEEEEEEKGEEERQIKEKARVDDLWASFKRDTATSIPKQDGDTSTTSICSKEEKSEDKPKMVKIKKTYDFAGDEVVVEKEVAADSKEAQQFLHTSSTISSPSLSTSSPSASLSKATVSETERSSLTTSQGTRGILAGSKRSGLTSVLQSLSKKPKMSTLEKSKLDWNKFKADEGLEDELTHQRKDGYLERQEFLQRTDLRQYELEREERLKKYHRLH